MKNLPTLRNDSSFVVQFINHSLEDKCNFAVCNKDCQKFFNSMQSAGCQMTVPLKCLVIIIMRMLGQSANQNHYLFFGL